MKILGLDTSTRAATVAVMDDECLVCEFTINNKKTHSQKLMPMIESMLKLSDIKLKEIDLIALCIGPGSFTGIRIGTATAKAISQVYDLPIVAINSLEVVAENAKYFTGNICSILDAQRTQVYTGMYRFNEESVIDEIITVEEPNVIEIQSLIETINEKTIFIGEASQKYKQLLLENKNIVVASMDLNISRGAAICEAGLRKFKNEKDIYNCYNVKPVYIRKSQAEMQYEEKMRKLKSEEK